jgi:hypothetical protein
MKAFIAVLVLAVMSLPMFGQQSDKDKKEKPADVDFHCGSDQWKGSRDFCKAGEKQTKDFEEKMSVAMEEFQKRAEEIKQTFDNAQKTASKDPDQQIDGVVGHL